MSKKLKGFPHEGVLTQLKPSKAEKKKVGVFALMNIAVATDPFPAEDKTLLWVSEKELQALNLPEAYYKIYDRLGALEGDRRYVPASWSTMEMSCYICDNPERPNLRYDNDTNTFYTMRPIKPGQELTVDYSTIGE